MRADMDISERNIYLTCDSRQEKWCFLNGDMYIFKINICIPVYILSPVSLTHYNNNTLLLSPGKALASSQVKTIPEPRDWK